MTEFKITQAKGFQIVLENGWTVSVQFGPGNYCDHYNMSYFAEKPDVFTSGTAEIAAWDKDGSWFTFESGDDVQGYQSVTEVLDFINKIRALPGEITIQTPTLPSPIEI